MPIASHKPNEVVTQPNLPKIQPDHVKGIIYDDANKPLHSLISYIEGAPWTVDYYAQVVGEHNDLREIDPGQNSVYQQYQKTIGLEIRVANALSSTADSETGNMIVTGSGYIYPFMTPNKSDYFIADTADSQKAILRITQVERRTFNRDSVYSIEYQFIGFVSQSPEIFSDLESKVIRSYHFSKERLLEGLQPTIKSEEYQKVTSLKAQYSDIARYYFDTFFDRRYFTLVIPGQDYAVYDSMVVDYVLKLVDTNDSEVIRLIKDLPVDDDRYLNQMQFWKFMSEKNFDARLQCNDVMGMVSKVRFNSNPFIRGLRFTNIEYLIYPDTPDTSALVQNCFDIKELSTEVLQNGTGFKGSDGTGVNNTYTKADTTYDIIHDVLVDNKYVLSNNFYAQTTDQSVLEILVKDYLKGQSLDLDMLNAVIAVYKSWKRLEQFYYGPILLTLIKEANRAQYT